MSESNPITKSPLLRTGFCSLTVLGLISLVFSTIGCDGQMSGKAVGSQNANAGDGWELVGEESGFVTHRKLVEGSSVFAFRGETVVDVPMSKILTVFLDTNRRKDWVDRFSSTEDIQSFGDFDKLYWIRFGLPFPLTDRDYLLRVTAELDPNNRVFIANIKSAQSPQREELDCCVRAEAYRTYYRFESLPAQQKTKIKVEVHTDPKGMIPGWAVNMIQKNWPRKTLSALVREADKDGIPGHSTFKPWDSLGKTASTDKSEDSSPVSE